MSGNNLTAVIIEDELPARAALKQELKRHCPNISILGEAGAVQEAVDLIAETDPKLIFLDIKLSNGSGFDVLKQIQYRKHFIVFTTAYSSWAIEAIKFSALDYLLKPIDGSELKSAIDRAIAISAEDTNLKMKALVGNEGAIPTEKKIAFQTSQGVFIYKLSEIIHFEADVNYTRIFSQKGQLLIAKTLKEIEGMVARYGFIRIHQSHLINMGHVSSYQNKAGNFIEMSDGTMLPVSQRRRPAVIEALLNLNNS